MNNLKYILYILIFIHSSLYSNVCDLVFNESTDKLVYRVTNYNSCTTALSPSPEVLCRPEIGAYVRYDNKKFHSGCIQPTMYQKYSFNAHYYTFSRCPDGKILDNDGNCIEPCSYEIPAEHRIVQAFSDASKCEAHKNLFFPTQGVCVGCLNAQSIWSGVLYAHNNYADPNGDHNNDGIPNKCDKDHLNFDNFDCDSDGIPNNEDDDIDGDGTPNDFDSTPNGGLNDTDSSCTGENVNDVHFSSIQFPKNEYLYDGITYGTCLSKVELSNVDGAYFYRDKSSSCENDYCYVHYIDADCRSTYKDYYPSGNNWAYEPTYRNDNDCINAFDPLLHTAMDSASSTEINCPSEFYCFLQYKYDFDSDDDSNSEDNNSNMNPPDLNSTSSDLRPLLQATNTTNSHLQDLKDKVDKTNDGISKLDKSLNDIKNNSTATLDTLNSLKNDNNQNFDKLNSKLDLNNDSLSNINNAISDNTDVLSNIKDLLTGSPVDTSEYDNFDTLLSENDTFFETWKNEFSTFSDNVNNQLSDIDSQYNNARNIFDSSHTFTVDPGSTNGCFDFQFHGKTISFDLCTPFSIFSPIVYFVFTLIFMIATFRFMVNHLLRGLE